MELMLLLRLMVIMKSAYANAEPMESITPMGFVASLPSPCVMMITPMNVATIDAHTGHDGTTPRNAMMRATNTGNRNTNVVARPEAM